MKKHYYLWDNTHEPYGIKYIFNRKTKKVVYEFQDFFEESSIRCETNPKNHLTDGCCRRLTTTEYVTYRLLGYIPDEPKRIPRKNAKAKNKRSKSTSKTN